MVSEKGDIPDRSEVRPKGSIEVSLLEDVLDGGEVDVTFEDGYTETLHEYDTYVFKDTGTVYTKSDPDDLWFRIEDVIRVRRHYE